MKLMVHHLVTSWCDEFSSFGVFFSCIAKVSILVFSENAGVAELEGWSQWPNFHMDAQSSRGLCGTGLCCRTWLQRTWKWFSLVCALWLDRRSWAGRIPSVSRSQWLSLALFSLPSEQWLTHFHGHAGTETQWQPSSTPHHLRHLARDPIITKFLGT